MRDLARWQLGRDRRSNRRRYLHDLVYSRPTKESTSVTRRTSRTAKECRHGLQKLGRNDPRKAYYLAIIEQMNYLARLANSTHDMVDAMRYGSTPISSRRVMVVGASFVCTVESRR